MPAIIDRRGTICAALAGRFDGNVSAMARAAGLKRRETLQAIATDPTHTSISDRIWGLLEPVCRGYEQVLVPASEGRHLNTDPPPCPPEIQRVCRQWDDLPEGRRQDVIRVLSALVPQGRQKTDCKRRHAQAG